MKNERLRRGWSQQEAGFRAGVQAADISRMESGRLRPYPAQARRLGRLLGLTPERLQEPIDESFEAGELGTGDAHRVVKAGVEGGEGENDGTQE